MMRRFKLGIFLLTILFLAAPFTGSAQDLTFAFNPSVLISDERFSDVATLGGVEGIQRFLESQGSVLANTQEEFLIKLREPGDAGLKSRLPDPRPNLGRLRTAAELIYDASTSAGLNPQVVLVTLQKEQSLITGNFTTDTNLQRALDRALGFGCPDGGVCGDIFLGFYHQLFGNFDAQDNRFIGMPASLIRSFYFESGGTRVGRGPAIDAAGNAFGNGLRVRISRVGDTIVLENTQGPPNNAPATQTVVLTNFATAALYRYTPHVYNGNFNFARFFNQWFKYPNGTLIQASSGAQAYVIDNGLKRPISSFVMSQRGLDPLKVITVSPLEFAEFPTGDVMTPSDGSLLKNSLNQIFLMENGERKLLSSFVAQQRKLDLGRAVIVPDQEISSYKDGGVALPAEGTLVKSRDNPAVYVIMNNEKRLITAYVFRQRGFRAANILTAETGELDTYPTGTIMPPLDGTLIKSQSEPAVYHVGNGLLQPLTLFVFTQRGFKFSDVITVPNDELSQWTVGKPMPPETGILVKSKTSPTVYYMEAGVRKAVSYGVFLARRFKFSDVLMADDSDLAGFEQDEDLTLPERALVKLADNPAVYYLVDGVLRPLTLTAFQNRRLLFEDVVTISPEELTKYPVGTLVEN